MSPVVPGITGNGLAMRAGSVLQALATWYDTWLLATPLHGPVDAEVPEAIASRCRGVQIVRPAPAVSLAALSQTLGRLESTREDCCEAIRKETARAERHPECVSDDWPDIFDRVHLYRLTSVPLAGRWLAAVPKEARSIDLDEAESATRFRLAQGYAAEGEDRARFLRIEGLAWARLERRALATFGRTYVCSPRELAALPQASDAGTEILPNVLPEADAPPPPPAAQPFTFLFVGTLASPANAQALEFLCRDVVPRLRASTSTRFRVMTAGAGASPALADLAGKAGVELRGRVDAIDRCYAESNAVVAPMRSGGGTRLKVIEAMRVARPIVATTEAVAGLALRDGAEVLLGDNGPAFAGQCRRLMEDPSLGPALARGARAVYLRDHTPARMAQVLAPT